MTEITRSIEIDAPIADVWSHINPKNWTKIFDSVKEMTGFEGGVGVGTQAQVVAGADEAEIRYRVEITEFDEPEKIVYKRFGGPLAGTGMLELKSLHNATRLTRTSFYDDDLSDETMSSISHGMEKDNARIKKRIESD